MARGDGKDGISPELQQINFPSNANPDVPLSEQIPPGTTHPGPTPPPPDPFAFHFPEAPDYGALYAQQAADAAAAQQAALRKAGEQERDQLYADYLNAAGTATDFINTEIGREQANANLLGIDYGVTDDQKLTRISNYFASIWGEGDQSRLEGLFGQWGKPKGFDGFTLTRGNADAAEGGSELPGDQGVATTQGTRPKKALTSTDEETLGNATVLGA